MHIIISPWEVVYQKIRFKRRKMATTYMSMPEKKVAQLAKRTISDTGLKYKEVRDAATAYCKSYLEIPSLDPSKPKNVVKGQVYQSWLIRRLGRCIMLALIS